MTLPRLSPTRMAGDPSSINEQRLVVVVRGDHRNQVATRHGISEVTDRQSSFGFRHTPIIYAVGAD